MKRILFFAIALLFLLPASAFALTGQSFPTFETYYQADVTFINDNDNRHLLPMVLSQRSSGTNDGKTYYDLYGDVLTVTVVTDVTGVIETCDITLTAPASMEYGSSTYNDFAISGYHSYAFLMAMVSSAEPATRYELVTDVVQGMKDGEGAYTRQTGVYTLTCMRSGSTATLSFVNNGLAEITPTPDPDATPEPVTDDTDDSDGYIG